MLILAIRTVLVVAWFFISSALTIPILAIRPGHAYNTVIYTRFVLPVCLWLCGIKLEIRNRQRLYESQPCVYVCNHQSFIDLFVHGVYHPSRSVTVGKKSIIWIPIFGWVYALVGSVFIDRKNHGSAMSSMNSALQMLQSGKNSIWIFPEGTRSNARGLMPFKRGAFHLAINAGRPIVPISTSQYFKTVSLKRLRAGKVVVEILEPISTVGMTPADVDTLMARTRDVISSAFPRLNQDAGLLPGKTA